MAVNGACRLLRRGMPLHAWFGVGLIVATAGADEAPGLQHQPVPCTVPRERSLLCATITDDLGVASARLYFRPAGERYFSWVAMTFDGLRFCGALPAPRENKAKALEYYMYAVDETYQSARTSTYRMQVEPESLCEFPPIARATEPGASLVVHATHKKQGRKLHDAFDSGGVSFVVFAAAADPVTHRRQ